MTGKRLELEPDLSSPQFKTWRAQHFSNSRAADVRSGGNGPKPDKQRAILVP